MCEVSELRVLVMFSAVSVINRIILLTADQWGCMHLSGVNWDFYIVVHIFFLIMYTDTCLSHAKPKDRFIQVVRIIHMHFCPSFYRLVAVSTEGDAQRW